MSSDMKFFFRVTKLLMNCQNYNYHKYSYSSKHSSRSPASLEINLGNLPVIVSGKKSTLSVMEDFLPVIFFFISCLLAFKCNVHQSVAGVS